MIPFEPPRAFWVTDRDCVERPDFIDRARAVLRSAGGALQLRAHGAAGRTILEIARALREAVVPGHSELWINDRVDVALCVRADGVQLGRRSLPVTIARRLPGRSCRIGASVHDAEEAESAVGSGADLLVLGSVYATGSHPEAVPLGPETIRRSAEFGRPVVAIGGMTIGRVAEVMAAGAWGIAVRSGVWHAEDPGRAASEYAAAVRRAIEMVPAPPPNR